MANQNTPEYLDKIKTRLFENLRMLPHAPGVQMQDIPEDAVNQDSDDEDRQSPDKRISIRASDKRVQGDNEYSDSEDEGEGGRRNTESHKQRKKLKTDHTTNGGSTPAGDAPASNEKPKEEEKPTPSTDPATAQADTKDLGTAGAEEKPNTTAVPPAAAPAASEAADPTKEKEPEAAKDATKPAAADPAATATEPTKGAAATVAPPVGESKKEEVAKPAAVAAEGDSKPEKMDM